MVNEGRNPSELGSSLNAVSKGSRMKVEPATMVFVDNPLSVGKQVFIQTVSVRLWGAITVVINRCDGSPVGGYILTKCSAMDQNSNEFTHYPESRRVFVNGQHIVTATEWEQKLPVDCLRK